MTETAQKTALITGASRGLGSALALALAPTHHIIAVARTQGGLEDLDDNIKAMGGTATLVPMDLTDEGACEYLGGSLAQRWGGVDLWAHTAIHGAPLTPAAHIDNKDFNKSLAGNVNMTRFLIRAVEPLLRAKQGRAMFFDDTTIGEKFYGSYGATKAAQIAIVKNWQAETINTGPEVLISAPDAMGTGLRARFFPGEDKSALADIHAEATKVLSLLG
ncbi:SDR family NAD(P)-dependent oxidoreductase [Halocynthiibacter styelae]|uniref:SDR family oxidoreductase n=1 Tax=Halocynthiibacter styelae TaxID=2761955 RepID=A0A8J7IKJ4_9RHOB|nr:SDR family oxidoreductase [Paenihalocynthiibacter styelae]MBI1494888.1 SDR family oxidoreductase [Paenihalocynthiibacter styelae]